MFPITLLPSELNEPVASGEVVTPLFPEIIVLRMFVVETVACSPPPFCVAMFPENVEFVTFKTVPL